MSITAKQRRRFRIRKKIFGVAVRPRLTFYKSLTSLYTQIINDEEGKTLASNCVKDKKNTDAAKELGSLIAQTAKKARIKNVVFDRAGFRYHGVIKAFAESARKNGLKF